MHISRTAIIYKQGHHWRAACLHRGRVIATKQTRREACEAARRQGYAPQIQRNN
jgi:hypothetical protein